MGFGDALGLSKVAGHIAAGRLSLRLIVSRLSGLMTPLRAVLCTGSSPLNGPCAFPLPSRPSPPIHSFSPPGHGTMKAKQTARIDGDHNIIVQADGDGIHIQIGLPHLTLIPPRNRLP